jgi:PTS system nitrogen regulatory IIA component
MEIADILRPDCTLCAVQGSSKKKILELISLKASEFLPDIDQAVILSSLMGREKMGSTGIGGGIALPHGRLAELDKALAVLVTSESPIEFDAIDNAPVDIFFAILVPEAKASEHLGTLAAIAQKLNDKTTLASIRQATTSEQLYKVVS